MDANTIIAWVGAGVAIIAAITGGIYSHLQAKAARRANRLQEEAVKSQYFQELRAWADETCDTLSAATHLCDLDVEDWLPTFRKRRHKLLVRLLSLRDRGRWFFPNQEREGDDDDEDLGYRDSVLDSLVQAYESTAKLDSNQQELREKTRTDLRQASRIFGDEILNVLDPRKRDEEFKRIVLLNWDRTPRTVEDATPDQGPLPLGDQPPPDGPPPAKGAPRPDQPRSPDLSSQESQPHPERPSLQRGRTRTRFITPPVESVIPIHQMPWKEYFDSVKAEKRTLVSKGGRQTVIDMQNRLDLLKRIRQLFATRRTFNEMWI